jgi:flavin reductase (DIM6/NTAB) family NADH-FMN oxidoreductase RutF
MKSFEAAALSTPQLHQYLLHVISPRPIALVSTVDALGNVNLSPFSFFNLFSTNPPVCVFSPSRRVRDNTTKHTLENLLEVPECVVHIVTYAMVQQTSLASTEFAKGVNEFEKAGFAQLAAVDVRPPRVAESPVQLECRVSRIIALGEGPGAGNLVLAEIVRIHVDEAMLDDEGNIMQQKLDLVARLGGDWYACIGEDNLFKVTKPVTGQGIGMDRLPAYVRNSAVLTGNDLAQLANVTILPGYRQTADYLAAQTEMTAHLQRLHAFKESRLQFIHQRARLLIQKDNVAEAWLSLLAGNLYEQKQTPTNY